MNDYLLQFVLSNVCVSLLLAVVALLAESTLKRPQLAHLLWLLVFIKLVTPSVVSVPVIPIAQQGQAQAVPGDNQSPRAVTPVPAHSAVVETRPVVFESNRSSLAGSITSKASRIKPLLVSLWLLSGMFVLAYTIIRVWQFNRLLKQQCTPAPRRIAADAKHIALRLGLKTSPAVYTTQANLSPMVWWVGGKVRIVIPDILIEKMDPGQLQWVLSHELAHVRRGDYLVRWLEWLACVCFWWNPVMWFARKGLRANEEICCDQLVLSSLTPKPKTYANSLLNAIEFLACPAIRPPAMASEINSGGVLRRRFKMIVSNKPIRSNQRWLHLCILLLAVIVLPFGVAFTHDPEAFEKRLGKAIVEGEISLDQAAEMMEIAREDDDGEEDVIAELKEEMEVYGDRLKAAVKNGSISEKDAMAKWNYFLDNEIAKELKEEVEEGEISEKEAMAFWKEIKGPKCDKKPDPKGGKVDIAGHFKRFGVSIDTVGKIKRSLMEKGFKPAQVNDALIGVIKVAGEMRKEGTAYKIDPAMRVYFRNAKLTPDQAQQIQQIARRISGVPAPKPKASPKAKTAAVRKAAAAKARAPKTTARSKAKARPAPKKKPANRDKAKTSSTAKAPVRPQKTVKAKKPVKAKAPASNKAKAGDKAKSKPKTKPAPAKKHSRDMDVQLKKTWSRLQAAVKKGDMTRQEARKKMADIKKKMLARKQQVEKRRKERAEKAKNREGKRREHGRRDREHAERHRDNFDLEAVGKRIRASVAAGKMTEKQAWERWNQVKKNQLKPRLEAAVKAGKMTREQVKKVWEDIAKAEAREKHEAEQARKKAAAKARPEAKKKAKVKAQPSERSTASARSAKPKK